MAIPARLSPAHHDRAPVLPTAYRLLLTARGGVAMPYYVALGKTTAEGAKNLAAAITAMQDVATALEEMGGKLVDDFALLGAYDFLFIAEAPNEEVMYRAALRAAAHGIITLQTMPANPFEEFGRLVREME